MNYKDTLNYIHGTQKFGIKLGLENIKKLLELLGNPQDEMRYIHIAGTNGKGSTTSFISNILIEAGYKVGIFTSPYLTRFSERMKINDSEIGDEELCELATMVREKVEAMIDEGYNHPTEFEIVTAIALCYFLKNKCDIVVLEVGLGGRFDSTNIIKAPLLSVITSISLDHMNILGDTIEEIAYEKAGIIKYGSIVVECVRNIPAYNVIAQKCKDENVMLFSVSENEISHLEFNLTYQSFSYKDFRDIKLQMLGEHQIFNAVTAIEATVLLSRTGMGIDKDVIKRGLYKTRWPGRFEIIKKDPIVILDGAHNIDGAKILAKNLSKYFSGYKIFFIAGFLRDKDYEAMVKEISPLCEVLIAVKPDNPRALSAEELALVSKKYCKNTIISDTIREAMSLAKRIMPENAVICAFGSLYLIGEMRNNDTLK